MMSNSPARSKTWESSTAWRAPASGRLSSSRMARGQAAISRADVRESALAKSVTSWPRRTSSSVSHDTTRSVPPYSCGGTLSARGATWAILMTLGGARGVPMTPALAEASAARFLATAPLADLALVGRAIDAAEDVEPAEEIGGGRLALAGLPPSSVQRDHEGPGHHEGLARGHHRSPEPGPHGAPRPGPPPHGRSRRGNTRVSK